MRFLADMGIDRRVVEWLKTNGHDAIHLREERLYRAPDAEVFEKAGSERRIILTFDLDFGEIVALSQGRVTSVVLFRLINTQTAFLIQRLQAVLVADADALEKGAIVVVEDGRHRVRDLPFSPTS